tara:strand:- start:37238 stop:37417 length:180 start_codon:yes stop_codon:yes gene_type:complete
LSKAFDRLVAAMVREGKEKSRALPSRYYGRNGDPANHVEFESEIRRQEVARKQKGKRER